MLPYTRWLTSHRLCLQGASGDFTDAQLRAVLVDYSGLRHICLVADTWAECLASLIHFQHIRSVEVSAENVPSLQSVHTLTHLERLTIKYGDIFEHKTVPHLLCANFSRLTSLKVSTNWQEPTDTFQYLTQLQSLKELSMRTATPKKFDYAALTRMTSFQMDNCDLKVWKPCRS